jgi:N-acyl-D-amino-acid deacylase
MLRQGVTTIIGGNCGSSLAPLTRGHLIVSIQKWTDVSGISVDWLSMKEFLDVLEKRKIGVNFGTLVGHSTLRRGIINEEFRRLKPKEMKMMERMLKDALREGALGLSTGLAYSHAKVAPIEEVIKLAKIVEKENKIYTTHIRGEAEELIPAIEETLSMAKKSKVSTEISHLKAMGKKNWPNFPKVIEMIEKANKKGLNVNFDVYPYTTTGSVLYILLPDWVVEGGKWMLIKRLRDPSIKAKVVKEMQETRPYEYDKVRIAISPVDRTFIGKKMTEIAQTQGVSVEEAVINMLIASEGRIITFFETLNEDNVKLALKHSIGFIASDGSGYDIDYYRKKKELVHPRCFGAFPRVLGKYVREEKLISWEQAIYKMTGGPAEKIGLKNRGVLKKGNFADITIFNPKTVIDRATFENPFQYPEGIECVIVNGKIAVDKGKYTGKMAGRVLRKS